MILITLPSRRTLSKRPDLEDAVIRTGMPTTEIETFWEFEGNFKYQMTVKSWKTAEAFVPKHQTFLVSNDKGRIQFLVTLFRREYRIRVSWYPDVGTDFDLANRMSRRGTVLAVHKEKVMGSSTGTIRGRELWRCCCLVRSRRSQISSMSPQWIRFSLRGWWWRACRPDAIDVVTGDIFSVTARHVAGATACTMDLLRDM